MRFAYKQVPINLSILDFKDHHKINTFEMLDTINLSILDFKGPSTSRVRVEQLAINLSILDFKVGC